MHSASLLRSSLSIAAAAALSAGAAAQIPDGAHVSSCVKAPGSPWPGDGGVFVSHPRDLGTLTPITGLPDSITFASDSDPGPPSALGANCVLVDPSNGGIIVGTNGRAGQVLSLHRITLDGLHASQVDLFELGLLVGNGGGVFELDWIDEDEVIAAVGAIDGPAGSPGFIQIARIDFTTGAVSAVDLRGFTTPGFINAIAYDAPSDTVYFGIGGPDPSRIFSFTLGGTDVPALVASIPGAIRGLEVDANGDVIAGLAVVPGTGDPVLVKVTSDGAQETLLSSIDNVNAFAIEPTTGQFAIVGQTDRTDPFSYGGYFFDGDSTGGGAVVQLAIERDDMDPAGPLTGVDVAPSPVSYGDPSGRRDYVWSTAQAPSHLAIAGETWDAVIDWPAHGFPFFAKYVASTGSREPLLPGIGIDLLVDPHTVFLTGALPRDFGARQSTLQLDIPDAMKGETFFVQGFFLGFGGVSATPGLRVAVQ
ncbi:MAG: hypothetical protein AAGB93_16690 [Planctomycetota bacterium]